MRARSLLVRPRWARSLSTTISARSTARGLVFIVLLLSSVRSVPVAGPAQVRAAALDRPAVPGPVAGRCDGGHGVAVDDGHPAVAHGWGQDRQRLQVAEAVGRAELEQLGRVVHPAVGHVWQLEEEVALRPGVDGRDFGQPVRAGGRDGRGAHVGLLCRGFGWWWCCAAVPWLAARVLLPDAGEASGACGAAGHRWLSVDAESARTGARPVHERLASQRP